MRTIFLKFNLLVFSVFLLNSISYSQEHNFLNNNKSQNVDSQKYSIFSEIEEGLQINNVGKISKYFSQQPYLSFSNNVTGYYSSNQAYYILEDFLNLHRVISFKFDNRKMEENFAYATGSYLYELKGKRDTKQIYLTLNKIGNNWYITQISIN
jgi:Domain of unknown function (DUF4783)